MTTTPGRTKVIGAVLAMLALPLALALVEAVAFHVRNRNSGAIVSSGRKREYLLHVPPSYDRTRPVPLVISLHGAGMWPAAQMETSQWNRVADREGFIVVYPAGTVEGGPRIWHEERGPGIATDTRFIAELIDTLEAAYRIDPARIYANGVSNGGGMSFVLSCTLSSRIAAVGMVGAALFLPFNWCADSRAVPMIAFHGTADHFAPYGGGRTWVAPHPFRNIPDFTASWARRNGCDASPGESAVAADVTEIAYAKCAADADVVLYRIEDGGHTWPGGEPLPEWFAGRTSTGVDASSRMWEFFRAHPLRALP